MVFMLNSQIIQPAVIGLLMPHISHYLLVWILLIPISLACSPGEFSSQNGVCLQCDISCSTCTSREACDTCYSQMFLIARDRQLVCEICYKINIGCDICITAQKCSSCQAGYYLQDDNTCSTCDALTPNCLFCQSDNSTACLSCKSPYRLVNGQCLIVANSSNFQSGSIGSTANVGSNNQNANIRCDSSQVFLNGTCYPAIAFCQVYNQNGSCASCNSLFVLTNGFCLPSILVVSNSQAPVQASAGSSSALIDSTSQGSANPATGSNPKKSSNLRAQNCAVLNPADPTQCRMCVNGFAIADALPGVCLPIK